MKWLSQMEWMNRSKKSEFEIWINDCNSEIIHAIACKSHLLSTCNVIITYYNVYILVYLYQCFSKLIIFFQWNDNYCNVNVHITISVPSQSRTINMELHCIWLIFSFPLITTFSLITEYIDYQMNNTIDYYAISM